MSIHSLIVTHCSFDGIHMTKIDEVAQNQMTTLRAKLVHVPW